jgi:methylated-DNA-[protein]-cysteine S-methyltransferase
MRLRLERRPSPLGTILLVTDENALFRALDFEDHEQRMHRLLRTHYRTYELNDGAAPRSLTEALDGYFDGNVEALSGLNVTTGGTDFQRKVWLALRDIPAGMTVSYGWLAKRIGHPTASRAVGLANGANPAGIVVPCHRVIGANGNLTGYGGGLQRKHWLLEHEQRHSPKGWTNRSSVEWPATQHTRDMFHEE